MANKLATQTYFEDFDGGQGAGAATYVTYAQDLDTNFSAIRSTVDAIIDEVSAFTGQNSLLQVDLLAGVSSGSVTAVVRSLSDGIVGARSFLATRITANTQLQVNAGVAFANGARIQTVQFIVTSSGSAGTRYVALNADGTLSVQTTASTGVLDLYTISWSGTIFDADPVRSALYYPDGDDFQDALTVVGLASGAIPVNNSSTFTSAARRHERLADRFENLERSLNGLRTSLVPGGTALGPISIPGSETTPGIVTGNGTTVDTGTGFFRQAANVLGFSASATERWRTNSQGILFNQDGTAGAPVLSRVSDLNTGLFFSAGDQVDLAAGGASAVRAVFSASIARAHLSAQGTAAAPDLSWIGDPDTGFYRPTTDQAAVTTAGVQAARWESNQQLHQDAAYRVRATRTTAQSLTSGANTAVNFTGTDTFDVGAMHDPGGGSPQNVTVPGAGNGLYHVSARVRFAANVTGYRLIEIRVGGTVQTEVRVPATATLQTSICVSDTLELANSDVVTITAEQASGGALDIEDAVVAVHRLW
jgi:hypothetical protein